MPNEDTPTQDLDAAAQQVLSYFCNHMVSLSGTYVDLTSAQTINGAKTFSSLIGNLQGNVFGNADTVTNGVYTTGSYADPPWLTLYVGANVEMLSPRVKGYVGSFTGRHPAFRAITLG